MSLYADDLLLYVTNPLVACPAILSFLIDMADSLGIKLILPRVNVIQSTIWQCNSPSRTSPLN